MGWRFEALEPGQRVLYQARTHDGQYWGRLVETTTIRENGKQVSAWVLKLETANDDLKYVSDEECWRLTPEGGWPASDEDEDDDEEGGVMSYMPVTKRGTRKKKGLSAMCC